VFWWVRVCLVEYFIEFDDFLMFLMGVASLWWQNIKLGFLAENTQI